MKPIVIKKDSLLCKIAINFGGMNGFDLRYGVSICEYNLHILAGLIAVLLITFVTISMVCLMISPVIYGVLHLYQGTTLNLNTRFGIIVDLVAISLFGIFKYHDNQYYKPHNNKVKEPSKLYLHWKSFKDKVCYKVTFE